ncbi:MAG TPA: 4-hydroxy-tetrahydrodipicolinate synthase [Solirubrobacterales bacterium]
MSPSSIRGVITAMITPFAEDGSVDLDAARQLARYLVEHGSHGVVVAGTTGENPTLSDDEQLELLRTVKDEIGAAATVIAGTGTNDTRHSVHLTEASAEAGADACLVVTPYYNKPSPAGLRAHFAAVAAATDRPIVLYNIPSRCVINMPPELLAEIAAENDNVVAVKQANNDELGPIEGLDVLAGNDEIFLRTLEVGGTGGILVSSHVVGDEMRAVYDAFEAGDLDRARELQQGLAPVYEAMTVTSNPTPVKTALELMGVASARVRLPMVEADEEQRAAVRAALEAHGTLAAA